MKRYIALLRGINVGGHKKILMADLRVLFESLAFERVQTYIQSGNVVFSTSEEKDSALMISEAIESKYGWNVPVFVCTASDIDSILSHCPFSEGKKLKSYFTLFKEEPSEENINMLNKLNFPGEEFHITPKCLYYYCESGYRHVKMSGNLIEAKLKVSTTTRNYRTMVKLLDMATRE